MCAISQCFTAMVFLKLAEYKGGQEVGMIKGCREKGGDDPDPELILVDPAIILII